MCHNAERDSSGDTLKTMHYMLVIPGLRVHETAFVEALASLRAPLLCRFLARARRSHDEWRGLDDWLLERFRVQPDEADFLKKADSENTVTATAKPSAPFACLGDGIDPGNGCWAHAAPVSLKPDRDRLLLADASRFSINDDEAQAIADTLNRHFGEELSVHIAAVDRWYIRFNTPPAGPTVSLADVAGRAIEPGRGGMAWHRLMNEMQMALHEHPVNTARELRGEPPINGVWLWGAGALQPVETAISSLAGAVPLARGLARHASIPAPHPDDGIAWLRMGSANGIHVRIAGDVARAELSGDVSAWRAAIEALEQGWLAPLVDALNDQRIGMMTLCIAGGRQLLRAEATRQDLKRFWRRSKPLAHWCQIASDEIE